MPEKTNQTAGQRTQKKIKDKALSFQEEAFCIALLQGETKKDAYKRAFPASKCTEKSMGERACKLAGQERVKSRIKELQDMAAVKLMEAAVAAAVKTESDVLALVGRIAFGEEVASEWNGKRVITRPMNMDERFRAIEMLGKHYHLFDGEGSGSGGNAQLTVKFTGGDAAEWAK